MKTGQGNVSAHKPFISQSPILRICSIFLHYRPGVSPQCVQLQCHFHPTLCSYLWCHWKMTKLEPRQNFLFHTPQAENCPLFTPLALLHSAAARLQCMRVHSLRSMPDLVNSFLRCICICAVYSECVKE